MSGPPPLDGIDHVHVHVGDRPAAERWYRDVLGLTRVDALDHWAAGGGPLTIASPDGRIHLALFERRPARHHVTIALKTSGSGYLEWLDHLGAALGERPEPVDHRSAWSLYFEDPDGNPYEITTDEYEMVAARLPAGRAS